MTGGRRNGLELGLRAQDRCVLPSVGRVGAGGRKTALLRVGDRLQRGQNGEEGMIQEGSALMRTDPQVLAGGPSCERRAWATLSKEGTPQSAGVSARDSLLLRWQRTKAGSEEKQTDVSVTQE